MTHHLRVSCSALETPASLGAISSIHHQVVLLNCSTTSSPPLPKHAHLVTFFLNCLPSVCYKSCNSSLCVQVVAFFVLKCVKLVEVCCLDPPPLRRRRNETKKNNKEKQTHRGGKSLPFGCFLAYFPPCAAPPHELHPFVHPSVWQPSVGRPQSAIRTGIVKPRVLGGAMLFEESLPCFGPRRWRGSDIWPARWTWGALGLFGARRLVLLHLQAQTLTQVQM